MVWVTWLAEAARKTGYPVVEVDGWQSRGRGQMRLVEGVVGHHTGTPSSAYDDEDYPTLNVIKNGHSSLSGPLSHLGLGRSGTIYVVAAGACNHAGVSDYAGFTNLNDEFLGIEAESDGSGDWTQEQLDCYPKLVGALLVRMERGVARYASHRAVANPPGRKVDPTDISDAWMRQRAQLFVDELAGGGSTQNPVQHTVAAGDTLWALSRRYGVTVGQLREWNNLPNDLIVVGQTLLLKDATPPPPPPPPVSTVRTLRRGDSGDDVEDLQRVLNAWYGGIAIDGDFGPATERAVKRAQLNVPPQPVLDDDGIVGPLTWKKLGR